MKTWHKYFLSKNVLQIHSNALLEELKRMRNQAWIPFNHPLYNLWQHFRRCRLFNYVSKLIAIKICRKNIFHIVSPEKNPFDHSKCWDFFFFLISGSFVGKFFAFLILGFFCYSMKKFFHDDLAMEIDIKIWFSKK